MRISDWSSDVCSSDLLMTMLMNLMGIKEGATGDSGIVGVTEMMRMWMAMAVAVAAVIMNEMRMKMKMRIKKNMSRVMRRSEESRVGTECVGSVELGGSRCIKKQK